MLADDGAEGRGRSGMPCRGFRHVATGRRQCEQDTWLLGGHLLLGGPYLGGGDAGGGGCGGEEAR